MTQIKIATSLAVCLWFLFFALEYISDEKEEKLHYKGLKINMLFIVWIFVGFLNKWW